jgi:hypothetical protein
VQPGTAQIPVPELVLLRIQLPARSPSRPKTNPQFCTLKPTVPPNGPPAGSVESAVTPLLQSDVPQPYPPLSPDDLRKRNRDAIRQHADSVGECRHQAGSWLTNPCRAAYFELGCISALADLCGNKNGARAGRRSKNRF